MLSPFANLDARLNQAVQCHLSNAIASYNGGAPFGVLLERSAGDLFGAGAVDTTSFSVEFCASDAPGLIEGGELLIDGTTYIVSSGVQPDAGGWLQLTIYPKV